jgi:hypothetical protein
MKEFTVEDGDGGPGGPGGLFGELVISEPDEFRNRSFTSHLVELPWTERLLTQRVEESLYAGKHMVFCRKHDDQLAIVSNAISSYHHHPLAFPPALVIVTTKIFPFFFILLNLCPLYLHFIPHLVSSSSFFQRLNSYVLKGTLFLCLPTNSLEQDIS